MVRWSRLALALAVVACGPARGWADVLITEATVSKAGGRSAQGVRSTSIKGTRMRIELVQGDQSSATLYDLAEGTIASLDAKKKRAQITEMAARSQQLETKYPRQQATTSVTPAGTSRTLAGAPCEDYTFVVRVPVTKDGSIAMTLTGAACIAHAAAGADDYRTFTQAASARDLVIGYASDNRLLLALTRGQTELYRALSAIPGIPYLVDITIATDGKGMLAGLVRKTTSGSRTSTVTRVAEGPLDDAMFAIPGDWKREHK